MAQSLRSNASMRARRWVAALLGACSLLPARPARAVDPESLLALRSALAAHAVVRARSFRLPNAETPALGKLGSFGSAEKARAHDAAIAAVRTTARLAVGSDDAEQHGSPSKANGSGPGRGEGAASQADHGSSAAPHVPGSVPNTPAHGAPGNGVGKKGLGNIAPPRPATPH
jgi:hypothetical protein